MKKLLVVLLGTTFAFIFTASELVLASAHEISLGLSHRIDNAGEEYSVNVYLPASYSKEEVESYPVIYLIDGGVDQDFKHIAGLVSLASINPYVFREAIVVGVETKRRLFELTSINIDPRYDRPEGTVGGADAFRAFLTSRVIPFTEKTYRTDGRRIVMGESLAGLFIIETLLKKPDSFTDYVAISPSLWYDDRNLAKSATKLLGKHSDGGRKLYITMANEGGTMQKGLDELRLAIEQSSLKNLQVKYVDNSQTESHWSIYHGEALSALRWILPAVEPEYANDPDPWYLVEGANPPDWEVPKQKD